MAYLYRHIRLDKNEPFYIGIGLYNNNYKYYRAYAKSKRNKHWRNIINITDYIVEILFDDLTIEEAYEKEIEFIKLYGRKDIGTGTLCNLTNGGDGSKGRPLTDAQKEHLRKLHKGIPLSTEHREKIIKTKKERSFKKNLVKKVTEKIRKKRAPMSDEHKANLSKSKKGKNISQTHKENISKGLKGIKKPPRRIEKCIYCDVVMDVHNLNRLHNKNCNKNPHILT